MYKNINFEQAKQIIDNEQVLLLDVRTEEEFITGHILSAINIPVDDIEQRLDEINDKNQKILVYCKSGIRSSVACSLLEEEGFSNLYNLRAPSAWPVPYLNSAIDARILLLLYIR